jgi:hypothetical protein
VPHGDLLAAFAKLDREPVQPLLGGGYFGIQIDLDLGLNVMILMTNEVKNLKK